jgi:hypothetical protein
MNEVEPVTNDDKRKLVREFSLLEEILDFFWVIEIALTTNALDFSNLTSASGGLGILEMDLWIFAQVDDRTKVVIETWPIQ